MKSNLELASQTCLKESENHVATNLPANLQTETSSLDNTVCCRDWDKDYDATGTIKQPMPDTDKGYKISQDKVSNYITWTFGTCDIQIQAKRRITLDTILFFLIMMGRWMKNRKVNKRWDQYQSQDTSYNEYLNWDIGLERGRKLFGFLKFKFKYNNLI